MIKSIHRSPDRAKAPYPEYKEEEWWSMGGDGYRDWLITEIFDMCGCVEEEVLDRFQVVLKKADTWSMTNEYFSDLVNSTFKGDWNSFYITAQYLDNLSMLEHGTSIRGSWTTEYGRHVLKLLEAMEKE